MRTNCRTVLFLSTSIIALGSATPIWAQSADSNSMTEQVIVTGVRGQPRTEMDSPVPVDVISPADISNTGYTDMDNILNALIPSFTVTRQANSTSGSFIRPISIRGLPEDETLLLLDGKRRQLSASVGASGAGAEGPDAAVIPSLALSSIQVLRDGAAAQYGSDAIAGVVNFILRKDDHGFEATSELGQDSSQGDGKTAQFAAHLGMPLPLLNAGYLDFTVEFDDQGKTRRAGNYVNPGVFNCQTYAQGTGIANQEFAYAIGYGQNPKACVLYPTGQPSEIRVNSLVNAGLPITENSELYYVGNFSDSNGFAYGSYRYPYNGQSVNGPTVRLQDGTLFNWSQIYPGGWKPQFGAVVMDYSNTLGYKGHFSLPEDDALTYDFSARQGFDRIGYHVGNDMNPSLGPQSPNYFDPLADHALEQSANADFTYTTNRLGFLAAPLTVSFGAEYLFRRYSILGGNQLGDPASVTAGPYASPDPYGFCTPAGAYTAGAKPTAAGLALAASAGLNCASSTDPVYQTLPAGSNSITGLPNVSTGTWSDGSTSEYLEADTFLVKGWELDLAVRHETFLSVGDNVTEKLATYVQVLDWLALRGSVGTGFHAPSPGMANNTNVQLTTVNGASVQSGLFPAYNAVSKFLGAKPLTPEKSLNWSAGFTAMPFENFNLTVDGYWIRMFGQLYTTSPITVTPAIAAQITAAGIPGASAIQSVFFLQNAFDSNTRGIDVVGTYNYDWDQPIWNMDSATKVSTLFNVNRYDISRVNIGNLFTPASVFNFEHNAPKWRSTITVTQDVGPYELLVRGNLYGTYAYTTTSRSLTQQYPFLSPQIDMEASYKVDDHWKFTAGMLNMFNEFPEANQINNTNGAFYSDNGIPWQGGYYFIRASLKL